MGFDENTATALLSALALSRDHGGADAALRSTGIELREAERFDEWPASEALALGYLAGRLAHRPREPRAGDPTSFVMDPDLVVRGAEGESILRLPWFEEGLFVGRQLPDISEMPNPVRTLCVEKYSAALAGERGQFTFTSYGHTYSVDALPVRGGDGSVDAVLAIAAPSRPYASAAVAYERTAERLDCSADKAERRAELHGLAGRDEARIAEQQAASKARRAAARARANAQQLRTPNAGGRHVDPPAVTSREIDVLQLASHGLTYAEIAEQLAVGVATIRTHMENVYLKLAVSDKAAAVGAALRHGLIE